MPGLYPAEAALGYSALARRDAQNAVTHFDRALAANATYAPALAGKGDALLALGRTDPALEAFEAALAADPTLPGLRSRADVLRFKGAQQEIAAARRAAEAGHIDEARKAYETAIAASPDSAFLYRELATVEKRGGDLTSAMAHAQRAVTLDPSDARALTLVGEIYEANKDWVKAAEAYGAANALEPGDTLAARADAMRERAAFETMPEEYRTIETRTDDHARPAGGGPRRPPRRSAAPRAGRQRGGHHRRTRQLGVAVDSVGDPRGRHGRVSRTTRFSRPRWCRRGDLASAVSHILTLIGTENPKAAARWRDPTPEVPGRGADASELSCRRAIGIDRRHGAARRTARSSWRVPSPAPKRSRRSRG